jgi:glycosyltransferase involved in cell wall biosynthesis
MQIILNAQLISEQASYRGAGVSNYSRQLLAALGELALQGKTAHRFTALVHARTLAVPGVTLVRTWLPLERPAARIAWEQLILPGELARLQAGLVHGLVNVLPLATRTAGVVTVHDLSFVRTPERLPPLKRAYLLRLSRASVDRAAQVIAVSRQTAGDLAACFGVAPGKITVVHNGVAASFRPGAAAAVAQFRARQGLPPRYLLYLGTLEPRKNLELLLRAFARWRAMTAPGNRDVHLVLAGAKGWYYDTIFTQVDALGLADFVRFPGFVPEAELPDWYRAAEAFVYPSLFEGFGLPVLEAMACGTPVLCSDTASLREVAGRAALTFPPGDETALAHAIELLVTQPGVADQQRALGLQQAGQFSWQRCAAETVAVYERAASGEWRVASGEWRR